MRKYLSTTIRVIITLLLLAYLLTRIDINAVTTALQQANPALIALAANPFWGGLADRWGDNRRE